MTSGARRGTMFGMSTIVQLEACPERLSPAHLEAFARDGYLAFQGVLTAEETAGARNAITRLVRSLADVTCDHVGRMWISPGGRFRVQFEDEAPKDATAEDLELQVRKLSWLADEDSLLSRIAHDHPKIRPIMEGILGPDPILFQDMALIKPPFIGSEKPWHQDNAYFSVSPLSAVCGVWIALDDATRENGCMHVIPGHHSEARKHIHDRDCEIPLNNLPLDRVVPVEIPAGGALFFAGMLPHQTPPNSSPQRRRALQNHYRTATSQVLPREEYDDLYREYDGMGQSVAASCAQGWKE